MKKRILSCILILSLTLTVTLSPAANAAAPFEDSGFILSDISLGAPESDISLKGAGAFPSYYSSKDLGYTSGVDNQLTSDICWAFTHNELLEINSAKKYGVKYDFSEQAMKFETSCETNSLYGYMRDPNGSGNEYFSTAYLARTGSVTEEQEPFSIAEERTVDEASLNRIGRLVSVPMYQYGVNSDNTLNREAIDTVKALVTEYGAVGSSLFYDQSNAYQPVSRVSYYYNGFENTPNHSVTIIGWDDSYDASNFSSRPSGNGAFIVKNSWGLYHADNTTDIVYVSYYDRHITNQLFATDYEIENSLYDSIYQYDYMGMAQTLSAKQGVTLAATRFVAEKPHETVTAVSTYITQPSMSVRVMICTDGNYKSQSSYNTVYRGSFAASGYYVLPITPTTLSGNEYYVAVEYSSDSDSAPVAIQCDIRRLISNSVSIPNTCFIGTSLSELNPLEKVCDAINSQAVLSSQKINNAMLCIKAFTKADSSTYLENAKVFTDVKKTAWYADVVDYAAGAGLFSGVSPTEFGPELNMSRAMLVQALANLANEDLGSYKSTHYTDVPTGKWYTPAVAWATKNGIVDGMTPTTFEPNENVTREQMCVMLLRYARHLNFAFDGANSDFSFEDDADIHAYAKASVYTCYKYGIINGMTPTAFEPRGYATRAHVATLFTNFCKKYIY